MVEACGEGDLANDNFFIRCLCCCSANRLRCPRVSDVFWWCSWPHIAPVHHSTDDRPCRFVHAAVSLDPWVSSAAVAVVEAIALLVNASCGARTPRVDKGRFQTSGMCHRDSLQSSVHCRVFHRACSTPSPIGETTWRQGCCIGESTYKGDYDAARLKTRTHPR